MSIAVICTNVSCDSAKLLATAIKGKFFNGQNVTKKNFESFDHVFKYGFSPKIKANNVFNTSKATLRAINKIDTLDLLKDDGIAIEYTTKINTALQWIEIGHIVVARNEIKGANGAGLDYCYNANDVRSTPAKFWTKYIPHTHEFRVNVWRGKVVSIYDKIQLNNGKFKFNLWQGQEEHPQLVNIAKIVYKKIKLDWCGIDIIRDETGKLFVLEVNSAPVLYPFTIKKLANEIKKATE
jgi:glutathione synthase/RimK-type ligase-like ATP-grasp enzyme